MSNDARPQGAVEQALSRNLFGRFTTIERVVVVGASALVLLKNNPERVGWILVNTGGQQLTFRIGRTITSGQGFLLVNNGDTASTNYLEDGQFPTNEINIVAAAAGGECYVVEYIRDSL